MPQLSVNGVRINVEERGSGPETIVFSHGLLFSGEMFGKQIDMFEDRYRCITFDFRGQGHSEVTESGYDMDTLTEDAAAIIEKLECAPCHFLGLSMGGFVGMRMAIRHGSLLKSLMLLDTSADPEDESNIGRYRMLNFVARWFGLGVVASRVMRIMFADKFLNDPTRAKEREFWRKQITGNHRIGITRAVKGVIDREGVYDDLGKVSVPTLIVVGDQDAATVPAKAERIHSQIRDSKLVVIPYAGHMSNLEEPVAVSATIEEFLDSLK